MIVKLLEERPFLYKGIFTFLPKDYLFEVIDTKELFTIIPKKELFYKVKDVKFNIVYEGWNISTDFEVLK